MSKKVVAVTALAVGSLLAGTASASAAGGSAEAAPSSLTWVGEAVPSDAAPAGKVARYQADPEAGTITFLGFGEPEPEPEFTPFIVVNNPPRAGDCVLAPTSVPYASYGFRGAGTINGTWANRQRITAGVERCAGTYRAQSGGPAFNTPVLAPGATIVFTSPAVFSQVRI
ncbi:hypothetical protein [Streptomyces clavuligerus]|nr:hypothetical protein [Streptomyces clavuligerus]WDN57353.1 hypothetical protein LL058_36890 [Streptomyces clavuligerus]